MFAIRLCFVLVPFTALPPSTVAFLSENEMTISGSVLGAELSPLAGCVRAAFDEEPIFFSVLDDGGPAADARPVPPAITAIVIQASAAPRRPENALTTSSCVGLSAARGSYSTPVRWPLCAGATPVMRPIADERSPNGRAGRAAGSGHAV